MFIPGKSQYAPFSVTLVDKFPLDPETSGEETKVRLRRWSWCQQARHSSEEAEKVE